MRPHTPLQDVVAVGGSVKVATRVSGFTVVDTVAELLAALGSEVLDWIAAVSENVPVEEGQTLIVTVAFAPFARVPSAHDRCWVPEHDPWLGVADTNVMAASALLVSVALEEA